MSSVKKVGRVKATTPKAGVTKSRSRRYDKGGRTYKCGGKLKK